MVKLNIRAYVAVNEVAVNEYVVNEDAINEDAVNEDAVNKQRLKVYKRRVCALLTTFAKLRK